MSLVCNERGSIVPVYNLCESHSVRITGYLMVRLQSTVMLAMNLSFLAVPSVVIPGSAALSTEILALLLAVQNVVMAVIYARSPRRAVRQSTSSYRRCDFEPMSRLFTFCSHVVP